MTISPYRATIQLRDPTLVRLRREWGEAEWTDPGGFRDELIRRLALVVARCVTTRPIVLPGGAHVMKVAR